MNTGPGPPSVTVRVLALTSVKGVSVPKAFTWRKQKEVCRPVSPATGLPRGCWASCVALWAHGAFLHGSGRKTGDGAKALGSHSLLAHCSCCQSLTKFVVYQVNHFHAGFVLTDSNISTRLELCRVCSFGKAVLLLPFFKDTLLNIVENVAEYIPQMFSYKAWIFSGLAMNEWLKPGRFHLRADQHRHFLASERL